MNCKQQLLSSDRLSFDQPSSQETEMVSVVFFVVVGLFCVCVSMPHHPPHPASFSADSARSFNWIMCPGCLEHTQVLLGRDVFLLFILFPHVLLEEVDNVFAC